MDEQKRTSALGEIAKDADRKRDTFLGEAGRAFARFAPTFPDSIDRVAASIPSPQGPTEAQWERAKDVIKAKLKLPAGVKARVELPGTRKTVSGKREFAFKVSGTS